MGKGANGHNAQTNNNDQKAVTFRKPGRRQFADDHVAFPMAALLIVDSWLLFLFLFGEL
jgi:hypothetical protein